MWEEKEWDATLWSGWLLFTLEQIVFHTTELWDPFLSKQDFILTL